MAQKTQIDLDIKNFEKQEEIFNHPARYKIVQKGRRFGLTKGKANNFIQNALEGKFKAGLWVDTINGNIDRYVERLFIPKLRKLPESMWKWKQQQRVLYILDSYIDFRSADKPESIEGFAYDDVFLNEAGIILKSDYLWDNAIRPMLIDYKCPALVGGTPKGKNMFYELAMKAKDPMNENYAHFQVTAFDNPYIDPGELNEWIEERGGRENLVIRQEVFGEFLDDVGSVFRNIKACIKGVFEEPDPTKRYVMGVDLAKERDYTVIVVMDERSKHVVHFDRFQGITWDMQLPRIAETARRYNKAKVLVDSTGVGDPIYDQLRTIGVNIEGYKFTNPSKENLVRGLMIALENTEVSYPDIPELINELEIFEYDITASGNFKYSAPDGLHDDTVYALALALEACRRPSGGFTDFYKSLAEAQSTDTQGLDKWKNLVNKNGETWQTQ